MKYLKQLEMMDDSWIDLAVNCRKASVSELKSISAKLKKSYNTYKKTITDNTKKFSQSSFGDHKDLLVDYYTSPPATLKKNLRMRRNDHGLEECPYCGHPLPPDTLDHFIPKECWPEYAIHSNNLIPQCKYCASIKGTHYFCQKDKKPLFIHPIYSDLLSKVRFRVCIEVVDGTPKFKIKFASTEKLELEDKAAVLRHLKKLQVERRIKDYCLNEHAHWKRKLLARSFDIRSAFEQRVSEMPCEGEESSNWSRAFLLGALSCPPFIENLERIAQNHHHKRRSRIAYKPHYSLDL